MKRDLFLAILSMDSYNRSYGVHIKGLRDNVNLSLGNATIYDNSKDGLPLSDLSGFYAIAYTAGAGIEGIEAGTKIISYRGTNPDGPLMINFIKDALLGYGPAVGLANGPQAWNHKGIVLN